MGFSEETQLAMTLGSIQSQVNTCMKTANKVEALQKDDKKELDGKIKELEDGKIRALEDAKLKMETKAGLIAFIVSTLVGLVLTLIK